MGGLMEKKLLMAVYRTEAGIQIESPLQPGQRVELAIDVNKFCWEAMKAKAKEDNKIVKPTGQMRQELRKFLNKNGKK